MANMRLLKNFFMSEVDERPPLPDSVLCYGTEYKLNGSKYASFLYARDIDEAMKVCAVRGIGESLDISMPLPRRHRADRPIEHMTLKEQLHLATFYGWIAASSGLLTLPEVLGDEGVVHTLVHHISFPVFNSYDDTFWGPETVNTKLNKLVTMVHDLYLSV